MAINISFAGITTKIPGYYGVPLNEKQRAHNQLIVMLLKMGAITTPSEVYESQHHQGQVEITNEK